MRAFVAVDIGAEARRAVCDLRHRLEAALARGAVRWTKPDQLHLTLWFLGELPGEQLPALCQALSSALNGATRFRLHLAGLGAFPTPRSPRVVWVGLAGHLPQLLDVQRRVAQAAGPFGERQEAHPFHPHLTLGRVNRPDAAVGRAFADWMAGSPPTGSCDWEVEAVRLIQSVLRPAGPEHTELARFELA
jgi:2'-5' RNA ligase